MNEFIRAVVASAVWMVAFAAFVDCTRRVRRHQRWTAKTFLIAYLLFSYFQIILAKVLDLAGQLNSAAMNLIYLLIVSLWLFSLTKDSGFIRELKGHFREGSEAPSAGSARRAALLTALLFFAALYLVAIFVPPRMGDGLNFHMPMVANYVQNASLKLWPTQCLKQIYRINGMELQQLNLALLPRSDALMEFPNILALGAALIAVKAMADVLFGPSGLGWLAVLFTLTVPQFFMGASLEGNDILFCSVVLISFYFLIEALGQEKKNPLDAVWAALCVGLAQATKILGAPLAVVMACLFSIFCFVEILSPAVKQEAKKKTFAFFGVFWGMSVIATAVLVGTIYAANFLRSGSPLSVVPGYDETGFGASWSNLTDGLYYYFYKIGIARMFIPGAAWDGWAEAGTYGYLALPLFIAGTIGMVSFLFSKAFAQKKRILLALSFLSLWLLITVVRVPHPEDQRFMVWIVPCMALFSIGLLRSFFLRHLSSAAAFLSGISLVGVAILFSTPLLGNEFKGSVKQLFREHRMARIVDLAPQNRFFLNTFDAYEVLNRYAKPTSRILYVGAEYSLVYPAWGRRFERYVRGVSGLQDLEAALQTKSYDFLIIELSADEQLKARAQALAASLGYRQLVSTPERVLFQI